MPNNRKDHNMVNHPKPITLVPGYIANGPTNYAYDGDPTGRQTYTLDAAKYGVDVPVYDDPAHLAAWVDGWIAGRAHYAEQNTKKENQ